MAYPRRGSDQQPPGRLLRTQTAGHLGGEAMIDSEVVPSSLVEIAPILRVANEAEPSNPRLAYLCRSYAFDKAHRLDPTSSGHGVRQFKTALLHRLEREDAATLSEPRKSDALQMKRLYNSYYKKYIQALQNADKADKADRAHLSKAHQTTVVLFEVLENVSQAETVEVPDEIMEAHTKIVQIAEMYGYGYNILRVDPKASDQTLPRHLEVSSSNQVNGDAHIEVFDEAGTSNNNVLPLEPESSYQAHKQIIQDCTQDFNERNFIARGGYGRVYKGILTWGDHVKLIVAVKRLDATGFQGNKEFHTEVTMLSQYQHKNIITLIGFCDDNTEMILVYEYVSHGSLDTYLRNTAMSGGLSWPQLLKICVGVASALDYLHNHVAEKHRIIHRDIKCANILLDENWNAKLADFGLARIGLANQQNTFVITNLAGTYGYCDPQYERTGFLTKESDVYSFGVVLFEVLCGRLACVYDYHDERRFLHHLARTSYKKGELEKIIDPRIKKDIKPATLNKFAAIAYQCLQETREERPTIAEVAFKLKEAIKDQLEDEDGTTIITSNFRSSSNIASLIS